MPLLSEKTVNLPLGETLFAALEREADALDCTMQELIREGMGLLLREGRLRELKTAKRPLRLNDAVLRLLGKGGTMTVREVSDGVNRAESNIREVLLRLERQHLVSSRITDTRGYMLCKVYRISALGRVRLDGPPKPVDSDRPDSL